MRTFASGVAALSILLGGLTATSLSAAPTCAPRLLASNKVVDLSAYRGELVYVDFWASWCGPCKQSFKFMNELRAKYPTAKLRIVAISVDEDRSDALAFAKRNPLKAILALDTTGSCPKAYGVKAMPSSYIVAPNGEVIYSHKGFRSADRGKLFARLDAAIRKYSR